MNQYPYSEVFEYPGEKQERNSVLYKRFFLFYFEKLPVSTGGYYLTSYESIMAEDVGQLMGGN